MGDPFKGLEKILPVHVTSENILPAVPTAHDVINRSRIFHSQLGRHAGKTTSSIPIPSRLWFDPFSNFIGGIMAFANRTTNHFCREAALMVYNWKWSSTCSDRQPSELPPKGWT